MMKFNKGEIPDLPYISAKKKPIAIRCCQINEEFEVQTLEGTMKGNPGDYLMIGVNGEMYPCAKDIFEKTYQEVKEGEDDMMAKSIMNVVLTDFTDRRGLRQGWEQIDDDIQEEIKEAWAKKIGNVLKRGPYPLPEKKY